MNEKITYEKTIKKLENLPSREKQSPKQKKFFSEISAALMTAHLEYLVEEKNWFAGIVVSASMLDFAGKTRLLWSQKTASEIETRKINELKFAETIKQLLKRKVIDKSTFDKMEEIRHARNEAAHDLLHEVALSLEKKPNDSLEGCIRRAIIIVKILFSGAD